jgi:hypothetical protein
MKSWPSVLWTTSWLFVKNWSMICHQASLSMIYRLRNGLACLQLCWKQNTGTLWRAEELLPPLFSTLNVSGMYTLGMHRGRWGWERDVPGFGWWKQGPRNRRKEGVGWAESLSMTILGQFPVDPLREAKNTRENSSVRTVSMKVFISRWDVANFEECKSPPCFSGCMCDSETSPNGRI